MKVWHVPRLVSLCSAISLVIALAVVALGGLRVAAAGGDESGDKTAAAPAGAAASPETVSFSEAYLNDPANIEAGKAVWQKQCRHCHGHAAYPGKAPKLKPRRYTADFVYDRVTYGFRKMPSWEAVFTQEERMAVVAYVLSRQFSP